jgi:hypothetical protein
LTTSAGAHHILIGTFLLLWLQFLISGIVISIILEHTCLLYASQLKPPRKEALDRAYSLYRSSGVHSAVRKQFSAPPMEYSLLQFTEFILNHRLQ